MGSKAYVLSAGNYQRVKETQGKLIHTLSRISEEASTNDLFNVDKPREQLQLLKSYLSDKKLENKKLLEIGSGLGLLQLIARKEFSIDAWGVEPSGMGFTDAFDISRKILSDNNLSVNKIIDAKGEHLPFQDNTFDIVFSTNVLEHVKNPTQVIHEAIRVCTIGGIIQIVVPNFGSFFDGHYACFYMPYQPAWFWKWYIRYVLKRDPSYVDQLQTSINCFSIKRILQPYLSMQKIQVLTYGAEIFKRRMETFDFTPWAGLVKVQRWVKFLHRLGIVNIVTKVLIWCRAYSPLIITIRKLK